MLCQAATCYRIDVQAQLRQFLHVVVLAVLQVAQLSLCVFSAICFRTEKMKGVAWSAMVTWVAVITFWAGITQGEARTYEK